MGENMNEWMSEFLNGRINEIVHEEEMGRKTAGGKVDGRIYAGHAQMLTVCPLLNDVILVALKIRKRTQEKECGWYLEAREGKQRAVPWHLLKENSSVSTLIVAQ